MNEGLRGGVEVQGVGEIHVSTDSPEGKLHLQLYQEAHARKNHVESSVRLKKSSNCHIVKINQTLIFDAEGNDTRASVVFGVGYERSIPFFLNNYLESKIKEAVDESLKQIQKTLTEYIRSKPDKPSKPRRKDGLIDDIIDSVG